LNSKLILAISRLLKNKIKMIIKNFVIIAHIDHGKSTLADRFLEITGTVEKRKMQAQYLDQLELERERGITIKMAPVRMIYHHSLKQKDYILNLIDTPGHSDFSYEVSRALNAVEGAILLVDATQGIQAQTLANFRAAKKIGLKIIGAVNKIDLNPLSLEEIIFELADLINCQPNEIYKVSAKTGEGVKELLEAVVEKFPSPLKNLNNQLPPRALIFDSFYDEHKGVIASVRVFNGQFKISDNIKLLATDVETKIKEIGYFTPELKPILELKEGEIGYIATGIKEPSKIKIGDTMIDISKNNFLGQVKTDLLSYDKLINLALPGYKEPQPVVFVSFYPENANDYEFLKLGLQKLKLNDSALSFEPDQQEVLGRGFKVGFLGRLHFDITVERLKRELNLETIQTFPSVLYKVETKKEIVFITDPEKLPADFIRIFEPIAKIEIITPHHYLSSVLDLRKRFRIKEVETKTSGNNIKISGLIPLAELINDFDDQLKSATQGFASFSYELKDYQPAEVVKVEFLVAGNKIPGLSRFLPKETFEKEARKMVEKLKELLPRQQFAQAIQAKASGRIIAREDIPALRKDVTGYLYGGDRTRKMKLWQKQKRGKEKLKAQAKIRIPSEVFKELLKK